MQIPEKGHFCRSARPSTAPGHLCKSKLKTHSIPRRTSLEAEKVGRLHEELAAIVDVVIRCGEQAGRSRNQPTIEVLEVAVVANINCRARMHEVGDEKVGIDNELMSGFDSTPVYCRMT